jgi:ankyrin repeat protein
MVKLQIILIFIISCTTMACSQNQKLGPGYQFDLFKNTSNWELAKAVDREDTTAIKQLIRKNKLNVDLQEPRFGRTLLLLAIGNDKLKSTKALLEMGANLNIADSQKYKPIHEASQFIPLKKNTLQILELLIQHGADVSDTLVQRKGNDTSYFYVPLMGACENLACAKLLLEHGANPYVIQ